MAGRKYQFVDVLSDHLAKTAPIIGPQMKPKEKAIPTMAIALPRVFLSETSLIIAMAKEMLPC